MNPVDEARSRISMQYWMGDTRFYMWNDDICVSEKCSWPFRWSKLFAPSTILPRGRNWVVRPISPPPSTFHSFHPWVVHSGMERWRGEEFRPLGKIRRWRGGPIRGVETGRPLPRWMSFGLRSYFIKDGIFGPRRSGASCWKSKKWCQNL